MQTGFCRARSKQCRHSCLHFLSFLYALCRARSCQSKWSKDFFMLNLVFASKKALVRGVHDDVQSQFFKLLKNLLFGSSRSRIMSRSFITSISLQINYEKVDHNVKWPFGYGMNSEIQILWKLLFLVRVIDLLICLHQLVIKYQNHQSMKETWSSRVSGLFFSKKK